MSGLTYREVIDLAEHEKRMADQLAWDRFAAAAMEHPANDGFDGYKIRAEWAACFADAMMIERAQRLAGKPGEGK